MASKKTLSAANLLELGADRLAQLLIEISEGNAAVKRRLRMELAGARSPGELAREIRRRLATIARSRTFVDWKNRKPLIDDLDAQRRAIVDQVAKQMPTEGLDLMWRFLELAQSVFERSDDGSGTVAGIFHASVGDLGEIARAARPDPRQLADQVLAAVMRNDYGEFDGLIQALGPALGAEGLEHLKQRLVAQAREPSRNLPARHTRIAFIGSDGLVSAEDFEAHLRGRTISLALQDIADLQGDVDGYIAQYDEAARKVPAIAAAIAQRLLGANRASEALQVLDAAEHRRDGWPDFDWADARIDVLDALGRGSEAQAARWSCFERALSAPHLRDYLKRMPDFEDFEAEQRALDHAQRHADVSQALLFLTTWPSLDRAARLVAERAKELDGNLYEVLSPAADALAGKYPLAATLLLRAMIDFTLTRARSSRYGHAARHLRECEGLAAAIADYGAFETHEAYVGRLRREHGRKAAFWTAAA